MQEGADAAGATAGGRSGEVRSICHSCPALMRRNECNKNACFVSSDSQKQTENLRSLYCSYLKKEIENRDQEMAYRALKMRKLEKEILLLDKQLM